MLRKLLISIILTSALTSLLISNGYCIDQWVPTKPQSSDAPANWPADEQSNNNTLSRILSNYRRGQAIAYTSSSSITVASGEISCNSTTPIILRQNPSTTVLTAANLDSGVAFLASTKYYVYAVCDASATTNTFLISTSATTPAGGTNYRQIGSFSTDGSINIIPATLNTEVSGPIMSDTSGNAQVQGIFDYGTSASSFSFLTGNLKVAYGQTSSIAPSGSVSLSNLPFTSSSSFRITTSVANSAPGMGCYATNSSATAATISAQNVSSGSNSNVTCNWIAIGT